MISKVHSIPERRKVPIRELPHLTVPGSCLVHAHNITLQLPQPPVLTLITSPHWFFFIPIIIKLLTILLFWCLSTPFWTCDMDKNTFLNDMHHTPFEEEKASLIIWQKKHWGSHSDLESGNPYNNLLVLPHFPPPLSSKVFHILEHEHRPWGKSWVVVKRGGLDEDSQVQILVSPFSNCVNLLGSVPKRGWDRDLDAHSLVEG